MNTLPCTIEGIWRDAYDHCWAEAVNLRFGDGKPYDNSHAEIVFDPKPFEKLAKMKKGRQVFLCDMTDIAHEDVPEEMIIDILTWVARLKRHTFLLLTKRPEGLRDLFLQWSSALDMGMMSFLVPDAYPVRHETHPWPLPNLWIGVTAEDQARADERIPVLLQIPAAHYWVSHEPALGAIKYDYLWFHPEVSAFYKDGMIRGEYHPLAGVSKGLDWIVSGGETGPGARPSHPDVFRQDRDQCQKAGVAFYFKAWGDWLPNDSRYGCYSPIANYNRPHAIVDIDGSTRAPGDIGPNSIIVAHVGKRRAGRLLDGREHNEMPEVVTCGLTHAKDRFEVRGCVP